jgi:hypothetical protein
MADRMSICGWAIAVLIIAVYSAALVFIDPFTIVADWWSNR